MYRCKYSEWKLLEKFVRGDRDDVVNLFVAFKLITNFIVIFYQKVFIFVR